MNATFDELRGHLGNLWLRQDIKRLCAELGWPITYVDNHLSDLIACGVVQRVRRGVHVVLDPETGQPTVPLVVLAANLVPGAVVSHDWALELHGVVGAARINAISTHRKVTLPTMRGEQVDGDSVVTEPCWRGEPAVPAHFWPLLGRHTIRVVNVRPRLLFGLMTRSFAGYPVRIMRPERALACCIASIRLMGGVTEVRPLVETAMRELRVADVARMCARTNRVTLRRFGWLLEHLGRDAHAASALDARLPRRDQVQLLDPTREPHGTVDRRWHLVVNIDAPVRRTMRQELTTF